MRRGVRKSRPCAWDLSAPPQVPGESGISGIPGISVPSAPLPPTGTKKGVPEAFTLPGRQPKYIQKEGGLLLSRIALQYHRRRRA